jgi:SWI/SNF-related matrix-associated actin-dependent regulator 1 of chromatin subfamily A
LLFHLVLNGGYPSWIPCEDVQFSKGRRGLCNQKERTNLACRRNGNLNLTKGVGKTTQAIGVMTVYREDWPVLIITPASLKYNWKNEILMWLDEMNINEKKDIHIIKKTNEDFKENAKFYIVSYDMCWRIEKKILEKGFKFIICDEAHYLKSKDAKRTKVMIPILTGCKRLLFLSGTPILSKPVEIFNLIKCLRPDIFKSLSAFGIRYCDQKTSKIYYEVSQLWGQSGWELKPKGTKLYTQSCN